MRNHAHDYGRTNGSWEGHHGETIWIPQGHGDLLVTVNGYAVKACELLIANYGVIEAERERWKRWRMGDPQLPRPFIEYLLEIDRFTVGQVFAHARDIDADWDVYDAASNA